MYVITSYFNHMVNTVFMCLSICTLSSFEIACTLVLGKEFKI